MDTSTSCGTSIIGMSQWMEQDGSLVGTPNILTSRNVSRAPDPVNRPVPVPSVYVDSRGEIHNLSVGGGDVGYSGTEGDDDDDNDCCRKKKRLNLLFTRKGVMRSGDIHAHTQHDFVFSGQVRVWTLSGDGSTIKKVYVANEYIAIPPFVPHVFEFLEDTVLAEWWDGPFEAWFYQPYRSVVEASFIDGASSKVQSPPGRFSLYVLQEDNQEHRHQGSKSGFSHQRKLLWWWTGGVMVGLGIGYLVGKSRR